MMNTANIQNDSFSRKKGQFSFDWGREAPISLRLILLLAVSAIGHASCFYLFQVIYPPSERFSPSPARITFISPNDAASQAMLREVEDRIVFINSSTRDSSTRDSSAGLPLQEHGIEFRPSFANHELQLRTMPAPATAEVSPDPLSTLGPIWPSRSAPENLASSDREDARGGREEVPSINPGPGLSDRPVTAPGNWSWAISRAGELDGREAMLMLGINAEGKPEYVSMHSGIGGELDARIVTSSRNIRFEPAPGADLQWGKLLLRW